MVYVRVRLRFDSSPLNYAKKCWFVFDADQCSLVKDVAYLIARQFDLNQGIQLYMDDFLIPVNESAQVIRDNDLICVKVVEDDSENTSLVLSDDVQTPKAKRKKAEKIDNRRKQKNETIKTGVPRTVVVPKPTTTKTISQVKTLLNSAKVVDSSTKSRPSSGKLKAVTKQSSSGALHTTFHSSSSSSSSSSEGSSSESSEPDEVASKQRNNMAANKKPPSNVAQNKQTQSNAVKVASPKLDSGQRAVKAGGTRRGGRNRNKEFSNLTVGGDHDIFTTKSTIYKSPVQAKPKDKGSKFNHSSDAKSQDVVTDETKKSPAATAPEKKTEKLASQWDVQPPAPLTKISSAIKDLSPDKQIMEQPPRDYSAFPELQGPPRQGDKLAFKVLELSSSYSPVVSEYKEASVLSFDPSTKVINIEYSNETLMKLKFQSKEEAGKPGRFEIQLEEEEGEQEEPLVDKCDQITLDSLIEPKLIT